MIGPLSTDTVTAIILIWGGLSFFVGVLVGRATALADERDAQLRQQERDFGDVDEPVGYDGFGAPLYPDQQTPADPYNHVAVERLYADLRAFERGERA